ncbi:NADH dehydrogenase subunit N [Solimonas aquatica]|uniref:NADH-quinone oxidoreductase subunit N n=1 Tax=Solimonas aquatica TaxID=489703 RepID=A0A1H9JZ43_9GAMM|nr:NADH-quinone oxidoreductase subunit NuoN [Solimonas aquatica]SEQ91795.1 NADH dehydrogenase subunit N [Solimonas aquatica]
MSFSNTQWLALSPFLLLSAAIVALMLSIAFKRRHDGNATMAVIGLNCTLVLILVLLLISKGRVELTPLLVVDNYALFYGAIILMTTLATATLSHAYLDGFKGEREEMYLLLAISALGGLVLACAQHFASLFIGLEILSVPLYAMIAYPVKKRHSLEGGVKYLVLSAVASAFMLFGIALLYSQVGSMGFAEVGAFFAAHDFELISNRVALLGGALLLIAIAFKLSLVPFHLWTPDVYEGAPAPVTSYLATASKTAVFAVLLRYFVEAGGYHQTALIEVLAVLAFVSILVGNVLAVRQNNVKRMMAYSSIAHFGYCMVALVAGGPLAVEAVGAYLLSYVITTLGAFGVLTLTSSPMGDRDADLNYDYRGLFWRRPYLASIMTAMLLSLAGIPATAGFIGKFYVIAAGLDAKLWWLLGAVVVGSAIGLYYYLRLLIAMFLLDPARHRFSAALDWAQHVGGIMVLLLTLAMMGMGLFPQPFIDLIRHAALQPG